MKKSTRWLAAILTATAVGGAACDSDSSGGTPGVDAAGDAGGGTDTGPADANGGDTGGGDTGGGDTGGGDTGGADSGTADTGGTDAGGTDSGASDTGGSTDASGDAGGTSTLRVATFNTGLAHGYVKLAAERLDAIVDAVATLDADLVCLQEVWEPGDIAAIIDGAKTAFPHEYHVITDGGTDDTEEPACSADEAAPLKECVELHCTGTNDLAGCALGNCGAEFGATSPGCQQCMAANIGKNDVDAIFQACAEGSAKYTFEGRNGLLVLSRVPLADTDHTVMDSYLVRRAVLHARVPGPSGDVHAFCTHLTADLDDVPYQGEYTTWAGEQEHQVDQMAAWISTKASGGPTLLLGDMNAGPAIPPSIDAESPTVYDKLLAAGFTSPYVANEPPACTWCASNDLVDDASTSRIIDHVMITGWTPTTSATRVMDQPVTIDVGGTPTETNLSDHFGVALHIEE
ncbi:MAG: hypothetical protein AMXMBFR64_06430 [Myxococcales bacterium]